MKKWFMAVLVLGMTMLTGCSAELVMDINSDLSGTVTVNAYTTAKEEEEILEELGIESETTYAELMKEMEMKKAGVKKIKGVNHNCYSISESGTAKEVKASFIVLSKSRAVMDVAMDTSEYVSETSSDDLDELGFYNIKIKYPFKVAKANGKIQPDGYTVVYDMIQLQKNKTSRIYALSKTGVKNSESVEIKGVKNNKSYKKPVTVKVSSLGAVSYFAVNGQTQSTNSYYASKDGKYKVVVKTPCGKRETLTFYVDRKKPTTNIKNNKTYTKPVKITFKDSVSGVKKATLNGKTIKSGKTIKKNGNYTLKITDKAGNVKTVKFTVKK